MKATLVLFTLVCFSVAFDEDENSITIKPLIIGGTTALPGQFPYQASLRSTANRHFCGGSIYTNRWIISAAHCTESKTPASLKVAVGTNSITAGVSYNVILIKNHPSFNLRKSVNDVSLVKTAVAITFNSIVAPIPLSTANIQGVVNCIASGWGRTSVANPGGPTKLQFIELKTISITDCRAGHNVVNRAKIYDNNICTTSPVSQGLCMGDSGGPLTANGALIGIVSWGIPCGRNEPDVFTRVSSYVPWIESITGKFTIPV